MDKIMDKLIEFGTTYGLKIIGALLILIIGRMVAKWIQKLIRKILEAHKMEPVATSFICSFSYFAMLLFIIIATLQKLGMPAATLVTAVGAMGLAIGLALQGALTNLAAGILLVIMKPFKAGDFIEAAGEMGTVSEIHILTTTIITVDNRDVIVPNGSLTGGNIINYTKTPTRRVDLVFGVSYQDDLDKVREVITSALASCDKVLASPEPFIGVVKHNDSSVDFAVRPWCKSADYWDVYFAVTEAMKKSFDQNEISIPFPQRDVHLYTMDK